jgi:putative hydrolase of the HAD superfamily
MAIRFVLFDAVGTLLCPDPPVVDAYWAAGQQFGSQFSKLEIASRFRSAYRTIFARLESSHGLATNETIEHECWRQVIAFVFEDVEAAQQHHLFNMLWHHFARPEHWQLFDDVMPTWKELRARNYRLGIASNFDGRLRTILAGKKLLQGDELLFISTEIGFAKPSEQFYRRVEQQLQASPSEILLVGDDIENDVLAPRRADWQALALDRSGANLEALSGLRKLCSLLQ